MKLMRSLKNEAGAGDRAVYGQDRWSWRGQGNPDPRCDRHGRLAWAKLASGRKGKERGSAVLVVFILLTLMVMFTMANAKALHYLKQEMRLIEKRQLRKFVLPAKPTLEKPVEVNPTNKLENATGG